jgi:hypothetical protein
MVDLQARATRKDVAALLAPFDDDDLERLLLSRLKRFQALLNKSRQSIKEGRGLSEAAFWQAVHARSQAPSPDKGKKARWKGTD